MTKAGQRRLQREPMADHRSWKTTDLTPLLADRIHLSPAQIYRPVTHTPERDLAAERAGLRTGDLIVPHVVEPRQRAAADSELGPEALAARLRVGARLAGGGGPTRAVAVGQRQRSSRSRRRRCPPRSRLHTTGPDVAAALSNERRLSACAAGPQVRPSEHDDSRRDPHEFPPGTFG